MKTINKSSVRASVLPITGAHAASSQFSIVTDLGTMTNGIAVDGI